LAAALEIELDRRGGREAKPLDAQSAPAVGIRLFLRGRNPDHRGALAAAAGSLASSLARSMIRPSAAFCSGLISRPWAWPILSTDVWTKEAIQSMAKSVAMGRALSPSIGITGKGS